MRHKIYLDIYGFLLQPQKWDFSSVSPKYDYDYDIKRKQKKGKKRFFCLLFF